MNQPPASSQVPESLVNLDHYSTPKEIDLDAASPSPTSSAPLIPPTTVDTVMSTITAADDSSAKEVPPVKEQMTLIKAQAGVKNNMRKVNKSIIQSGLSHVLHIFLFVLLVFSSFTCGPNFQDENVVTLDDVIGRLLFGLLIVVVIEKGDQCVEEACACFLGLK
ncbi:bet1-like protein [Tanacetum coccineum]